MARASLHAAVLLAALVLAGCTSTDLPSQRHVPITAVWAENAGINLGPGEVGNVSFRVFQPATAAWNWSSQNLVQGCLVNERDFEAWKRDDLRGEACRTAREAEATRELLPGDYVLALRCEGEAACVLHVSLTATPLAL